MSFQHYLSYIEMIDNEALYGHELNSASSWIWTQEHVIQSREY